MRSFGLVVAGALGSALLMASCCMPARAAATHATPPAAQVTDGAHDFDFELGTWNFRVKRMTHPLSGSRQWIELDGTTKTCRVWSGRAQLEQMAVSGGGQSIEGLTLRLYNPQTRQWSLYWGTSKAGALGGRRTSGNSATASASSMPRTLTMGARALCPHPLRLVPHHGELGAFRAVFLRGRRQNVGSQLDNRSDARCAGRGLRGRVSVRSRP